ncbi:hypothetical protein Fmac_008629 [Flemingia macrophylla]|uniref:Reverse transcriptase domain-containing protein n=1 Tax=Flemingia macrophylla TaxID=520843 RepID=A0ABD1MY02_9FABA
MKSLEDIQGNPDASFDEVASAQRELMVALNYEDCLWRERAWFRWFKDGDRNTSFFFRSVKAKWALSRITHLKQGDRSVTDPWDIEALAVGFFQHLYSMDSEYKKNELVDTVIPHLVTVGDNEVLCFEPSREEVKEAVFGLNKSGAPGPDGFGGLFFQTYWHIIQNEVVAAVLQFFRSGWILLGLNANIITLIPKTNKVEDITGFRPIALSNFAYKIIAKILADKLSIVAARIVSPQQTGFIKGRSAVHNIMVASEAYNVLPFKTRGHNLILKLDFRKAFDTLNWEFLLDVLKAFGFDEKFCGWILCLLNSARLSVAINGGAAGFFRCYRGVRQGDPLSPLLFCLAMEALSRGIEYMVKHRLLQTVTGPRQWSSPSHLIYADDVLILCNGSRESLSNVQFLLTLFSEASGLRLNLDKCMYYSGRLPRYKSRMIASCLGFRGFTNEFTYLGTPIFKGIPRGRHFRALIDKIKAKFAGWHSFGLSMMGRVQLVNSVILGKLLYSLQTYAWPAMAIKDLEKVLRNFIWTGEYDKRKYITVA